MLGLRSTQFGPPIAMTASRAQGFNQGVVAVLDDEEKLRAYVAHPAHQKYTTSVLPGVSSSCLTFSRVQKIREAICDDTLVYDMYYPE